MTGQAAADARAHLAERQVDLVVHDQHALQRQLQRAARRADRAAGLVHVGLRAQHGHARSPRAVPPAASPAPAGAPLDVAPAEAVPGLAELPARDERLGDREADVVPGARVLGARVAEPDDQPVDRCAAAAAEASQQLLLLLGGALGALLDLRALLVLAGLALALADELRLGLDFFLDFGLQARRG